MKSSKNFKKIFRAGPFSIYPKLFEKKNYDVKNGFIPYEISNSRAIDIDEPRDLDFAKVLFFAQKKNKKK